MKPPRTDYDGRALVASHGGHDPRRIVWHSTEGHDAPGIRDLSGIAWYWSGISWGPGAHIGCDSQGYSARYVNDDEIAYHVQNRNTGSLGIEIVGWAWWSPWAWLARTAQLREVAHWTAFWSQQHGIPLRFDTEHGVSTHRMQSKRYGGTHYDPGLGFPKERVLKLSQEIARGGKVPPPKPPKPQPDRYWLWLRWKLGEGEFRKFGPSNQKHRPKVLPEKVPKVWWKRMERHLKARKRAELDPRTG